MNQSLKITWTPALSTGDRAIDVQHKYLVSIINDLAEAIETGKAAQSIRKIIHLLQYYTEWHFCREELCMDRHRCPKAAANAAAHKQFIQTFLQFREEYKQSGGSEEIALRMYQTLTTWLVEHIQAVDTNIGECVPPAENPPAEPT